MSVLCKEGLERFWADAKTYFTGTATPLMDGTAAVGSSSKFAREDHVHPSDTSKQDTLIAGDNITIAADGKTISATDTTYTTMTQAQATAGTDTTGRLVTAKILHDTYVNVTGDTMTGNLTIKKDQPQTYYKSTTLNTAVGQTVPSSGEVMLGGIMFQDNQNYNNGWVRVFKNSSDSVYLYNAVRRSVNGSDIINYLQLGIHADGTRYVAVSDPAIWRTALSVYSKTESDNRYVNVTGDTMTGALIMNNANIDVRSSNLTVGSTPSANTYGRQILLRDSAGTTIGYLQPLINTNGNTYFNINAYRNVNGTDTYNGISLGISPTGSRLVIVSDAAAWRSALGVTNIFKIVSVQMTNLTLAAGAAGQFSKAFTIPSGYTRVSFGRAAIDDNGTTSASGTQNVFMMNYWTSGSTCYVVCKNTSSAAVKFTANVDIQYVKTILY